MKHLPLHRDDPLSTWLQSLDPAEAFVALATLLPRAAVFAVDGRRNVVFFSDGAEELLGFDRSEVLGAHCLKSNRCRQCMQGCGIYDQEVVSGTRLTLYRADGTPVEVKKYGRAFFDDQGEFLGGVEVLVPCQSGASERPTEPRSAQSFHGLLTRDPGMLEVVDTIRRVAKTEATVLVRGESGTGKELVAWAIHAESRRKDGPFVAVNCASLAPNLVESELFGHVRGAFTGAVGDRAGLFEQASGGTLFLDEVGELSLEAQAKLLRVLEDGSVVRVGSSRKIQTDVRVVAATHRSLRENVKSGRFREDLMFRLRVVPLFIPALRERRGDIELLVWHFVEEHAGAGRVVTQIEPDAMRALLDHGWPGNVRELRNVVEYALAVGRGSKISRGDLPPELRDPHPPPRSSEPDDERAEIAHALEAAGGHLGRAAEILGISRTTLWRKRKELDL